MILRSLLPNDAEDYLSFAKEIISEDKFSLTHIEDFKITLSQEVSWIESLNSNDNNICLIIEHQKRIIANINLLQLKNKKQSHIVDLSINILRTYRNQGIGKYLIKEALAALKCKDSIKKIELKVLKNNHRAIHLYSIFGFKIEGELEKHVLLENKKYENLLLMGLLKSDIIF